MEVVQSYIPSSGILKTIRLEGEVTVVLNTALPLEYFQASILYGGKINNIGCIGPW